MSRRRRSNVPLWTLLPVVVLLTAGGYVFFRSTPGAASLRTTEPLDPALYYESANSLRGNSYRIDVEIDSSLGNSASKGRLFSVKLKNPGSGGVPDLLPVLVPPALGSLTIQKGQHYLMKVRVVEGGLLEVQQAVKP
jgi:hypothetical protein